MPYNLDGLTASEIDLLKVEVEKKLQQAQMALHIVEIEELELAKQIVLLQAQRKDLQIALSKARQVVRTLNLDIKIMTSAFWAAKEGGI